MTAPTREDALRAVARANATYDYGGWWHRHRYVEFYYDLRADEPDGPVTYHEIGWACGCGRVEMVEGMKVRRVIYQPGAG